MLCVTLYRRARRAAISGEGTQSRASRPLAKRRTLPWNQVGGTGERLGTRITIFVLILNIEVIPTQEQIFANIMMYQKKYLFTVNSMKNLVHHRLIRYPDLAYIYSEAIQITAHEVPTANNEIKDC